MRIHLDTDLGSDTDDACALAMLLGWPGVELVGITTAVDPGGRRAGYVAHCLQLAGRDDIPVAAGAEASLTTLGRPGSIPDAPRYWPARVPPRPSPAGAALDLLERSIQQHGARPWAHAALPDDLLNFHYDPVACAVAVGWTGADLRELRLQPVPEGEVLRFQPSEDGRLMRVVVDLDGASFTETWLEAVEVAQRGPSLREAF